MEKMGILKDVIFMLVGYTEARVLKHFGVDLLSLKGAALALFITVILAIMLHFGFRYFKLK